MEIDPELAMQEVMEHYREPQNKGVLDSYTFFRHQKNASCGDVFDLYVKLSDDGVWIADVKFTGEGCAISTASMSLFTDKLIGMKFKDAKKLTDKDVFELIAIPVSPARINCALMPLKSFTLGIEEFENGY